MDTYTNDSFDRAQRLATDLTDLDRLMGDRAAPAHGYSSRRFRDAESIVAGQAYFVILQFSGNVDPMFGGSANDLPLTESGFRRARAIRFTDGAKARRAFDSARGKIEGACHGVVMFYEAPSSGS